MNKNTSDLLLKSGFSGLGFLIAISFGIYLYYNYQYIGFPDGFQTDFDKSSKTYLFPIFFFLNSVFVVLFLLDLSRKNEKAFWKLIVHLFIVSIYLCLSYYFHLTMDHGQGG